MAVIFPFLMDGCTHGRLFVGLQTCAAITIILATLLLLQKIIVYYDISELHREIIKDYHEAKEKKNKIE